MKKLLLYCLTVSNLILAQSPSPEFNSASKWKFNYGACDRCSPEQYHYLYLDGDTSVDGVEYTKISYYMFGNKYSSSYQALPETQLLKNCIAAGACDPVDWNEKISTSPRGFGLLRTSNDSVFVTYSAGILVR